MPKYIINPVLKDANFKKLPLKDLAQLTQEHVFDQLSQNQDNAVLLFKRPKKIHDFNSQSSAGRQNNELRKSLSAEIKNRDE